jgi:two-component system sensor kinase FixL
MQPTYSVSWLTVVWSMVAAACLTLALVHVAMWLKQRECRAYLLFSLLAASVAIIAGVEYSLMRAETVHQLGEILRWAQLPVLMLVCSLVWFVRLHFGTGRAWLAYAVCGSRGLATVLNFLLVPNLNYREITTLAHLPIPGGETIVVAEGVRNPWTTVADVSLLLTMLFVMDATLALWRRGGRDNRRRAAVLGGSFTFFVLVAAGSASLKHAGIIHIPYMISVPFLLVLLAVAYELSFDVLRAGQLARSLETSESELRESKERMKMAASAAELALWVWDIVRDEVWITDKGHSLFGIPRSGQIDFAGFLSALHEEDRKAVMRAAAKSLNGGGDYESECRVVLPDGGIRWIAARGRVEFEGPGRPVRMRGVSIDVTRRKRAELEVQKQREELTHLTRVNMLGELSGALAHELNQPLTAILSNAQAAQRFLEQDNMDLQEVREILADIVEEDKRAGEVIGRLRLLLKKGEIHHVPVDVNEIVMDAMKLVRNDLLNQCVQVETTLASNPPLVQGDKVQLQQVLLNLIMNACDAMSGIPPVERRVHISTEAVEDDGVRVSICDRGRGIPAADLEQIFVPFMTTKPHGMGLGLAVCRTIITAHGGQIWASDNPDRGACVRFTLPPIAGGPE